MSGGANGAQGAQGAQGGRRGGDARLLEFACGAVWSMVTTDMMRRGVVSCGGITAIISGMHSFIADQRVQEQSCGALNNLANFGPAADAIDDGGGVAAVCAAMRRYIEYPLLLKLGSGVLLCLLRRDKPGIHDRIIKGDAWAALEEAATHQGVEWAAIVLREVENPFTEAVSKRLAREDWKRAGHHAKNHMANAVIEVQHDRAVMEQLGGMGGRGGDV